MKELIIGLNDNTKVLANLIRKENKLIDYINYSESESFRLDVSVKNTTLPCCSITTVKKSPGLTKATLKSLYKALFSDF